MSEKNLPKISIVTPSYNQAQFLEETIQSILSQNYPNLEYIIIDGGSTDGSLDIIKKYSKHLHYWCSEPDAGQYDAINKGFKHSTGDIMTWLNSDDLHFPWTLKTIASIMSELPVIEWLTTLQIGGCDFHSFSRGFETLAGFSKEAFLDGCYLSVHFIQQESTFWRRSLWQKIGEELPTKFNLAGDFALWAEFFELAELYGTISPLGCFRRQNNQKSRQLKQYLDEAKQILAIKQNKYQWRPSPDRFKLRRLRLKLHKIPQIRDPITSVFGGYIGKKIVRKDMDLPNGYWSIETYKF